ncbi:hypothetical protein BC628DRAFT_1341231 [Trametes gibbosa]|nr:hypothetical protein BC628DRAFT_1341231 [Trametes gibbosa]
MFVESFSDTEEDGPSAVTAEDSATQDGIPRRISTGIAVNPFADPTDASAPSATAADTTVGGATGASAASAEETQPEDVPRPVAAPKPPLYKRRWFVITNVVLACLGIAILFILLYPVVHAIAQHIVNVSVLNVDRVALVNPTNNSDLQARLNVSHAGIFSAKINFPQSLAVGWVNDSTGAVVHLGSFPLNELTVKSKRAYINQTVPFTIEDEDAFSQFTQAMITQQNFTWRLQSDKLSVQALKFPRANGLHFNKDLTLNGMNNFDQHIELLDFQLPSDAPEGGINFVAFTGLDNPSPFDVNLGTVTFDLLFQGLKLGSGSSMNTTISPGPNNITLSGRLVPQTGPSALASVSQLFTQYLNGEQSDVIARGQSSVQNNGAAVGWLSAGLQVLDLHVPFKAAGGAINPIKSIEIGDMALTFDARAPWGPVANSKTVQAAMELPFGFGLEIGEIQNAFNITSGGAVAAGLSTPAGQSTSDIRVVNSTFTHGTINITIVDTALDVPDPSHPVFSTFNANLTTTSHTLFQLQGHARAVANMSIGQITLDPIKFDVTSGLDGLQGLDNLVEIGHVDVLGGTQEAIQLGINVSIFNPSNLQLATGDLALQLFRGDAVMGTTLLPNLTLNMGNNSLVAQGNFRPNLSPEGTQTLNDFVGGQDVTVAIAGYENSTLVTSLLEAFEKLNISAVLPALRTKLLDSATLVVLPTTGRENNTAHATVSLVNPFTAGLDITHVASNVSFRGIHLGTIETPTNFTSPGKEMSSSPTLDFDLNMDPPSLFTVTRLLAEQAGLTTAQLDAIVALGGYRYLETNESHASKREAGFDKRVDNSTLFKGFDLPTFVDQAFTKLHSDVVLTAAVNIGEYATTLQYTQTGVETKTDKSLNNILPVLAQPIVQTIVSGSVLGIETVIIKDIQEKSFGTTLKGSITQAGPFDAKITFPAGLTIEWAGAPIGSIKMPDINIASDVGATFEIDAIFDVADVDHLTNFTKVMLTEQSFDWVISGSNLSGISVPGIELSNKGVTLKGMNNLMNGVLIDTFDLPSNDPAGGIHLTLQTKVTNPSQVGVELSSIGFQNFFGDINIGPVASMQSFTLAPQSTISLPLAGRLIPQTSQAGLDAVSTIFNSFIHAQNSNVTVRGDSAGPTGVTWLNEAIKSLEVQAVLPNRGQLDIIKSISLNDLDLQFSDDTSFDPATGSNDTTATFQLPFDFPVDIVALEQNITVGSNGEDFAQLIIPKGPSTTEVEQRIIHLKFSKVPFAVLDGQHGTFEQFLFTTATSKTAQMELSGTANTDTETAVGLLSLQGIDFSVSTSILGLNGLNTRPALVSTLDVNHGFADHLLIKANSSLFNPSNITLGKCAGDIAFELLFQDDIVGEADLTNLVIVPGNASYAIDVLYKPHGSAVASGQKMLENYLQGVLSATTIQGSTDSTQIESLQLAMSNIRLSPVNIPALHQSLISTASLVFPTDIVKTGIAQTTFSLDNPFTASINLIEVTAKATFGSLSLGSIDHVDRSDSPIHADGHTKIESPQLPFEFNMDPIVIIQLLLQGARNNHVDLGPLPDLFDIVTSNPNVNTSIVATVDTNKTTCSSGKQFDVDDAILHALRNLQVTLDIDSSVKIDDYATDLAFKQSNVTAMTDETALYLIGVVAPPIVQHLVDQANLTFNAANITNLSDDGFDLSLKGALIGTGPLDAEIAFVEPVTVTWNGNDIASIVLPPGASVCAGANAGVPDYDTNARLTITDQDKFTDFATFLLHNPSFEWTIHTDKLRVTALGTIFDNVSLSKSVSFKAFNNLPGVTINNFKLPSDDPAGGIHIETDSVIPSQARIAELGIDLGTVNFEASFDGTTIGPLSGSNLFLAPMTDTTLHLSGRMVPQSGDDLNTMGRLFSDFLAGKNQSLSVQGDSVQPTGSNGPVQWLSTAFKTVTLNVTLPGERFNIIQSIDMSDLELVMTEQSQAFAPSASSQHILAEYKNPFGFSLQVIEAAEDITLVAGGADVAELKLPQAPQEGSVSTGNVAPLVITFQNQTLQSKNDGAFSHFFAQVTDTSGVDFELRGTADVVAHTTIGDVPISGIPFNVSTSLRGINAFDKTADLSNVSIVGSGSDSHGPFIKSPFTTRLENPSNVSLQTVDVSLPVTYKDVMIGRAAIDTLNLVPGENTIATEFHYAPADANDTTAQAFLTEFLQTDDAITLTIQGDSDSSPFGSLQPGLEGVELSASLKGLNVPPIVTHINAFLTLDTIVDNFITIDFDIANPLDTDMEITFTQVDSGLDGVTYAHFDQAYDSFVVPAKGTANSGTVRNVLLPQGAIPSLAIIPVGKLDVFNAATVKIGEYTIPWLHLTTLQVPTTYHLSLSISAMKEAAMSISASKAGHTAVASGSSLPQNGTTPALPSASATSSFTDGDSSSTAAPISANVPAPSSTGGAQNQPQSSGIASDVRPTTSADTPGGDHGGNSQVATPVPFDATLAPPAPSLVPSAAGGDGNQS